jgi:hypothetical protein
MKVMLPAVTFLLLSVSLVAQSVDSTIHLKGTDVTSGQWMGANTSSGTGNEVEQPLAEVAGNRTELGVSFNAVTNRMNLVSLKGTVIDRITVTDMSGRKRLRLSRVRQPNCSLSLGGLPAGGYYIQVEAGNRQWVEKFIKG